MPKDPTLTKTRKQGKTRGAPSYAKAADLHATVKQGGKAQGTIIDYKGCLRRADEWLPGQLQSLRRDWEIVQDEISKERSTSNAPIPLEKPDLPAHAEDCLSRPMKCTPYMISLFMISECVTAPDPKGDSVLKSIRAAFIWRFEAL